MEGEAANLLVAALQSLNVGQTVPRAEGWDQEKQRTDNLAMLYQPPTDLVYRGTFEKAKVTAALDDKWLIVNLQSSTEFSSHTLNRDTWANEAVAQTIKSNFIFWQRFHDDREEGSKVCTFYRVDKAPAVLVIDPITGQRMQLWAGMISPERLLEGLLQFMDNSPKAHILSLCTKSTGESPPCRGQVAPIPVKETYDDEDMQQALAMSLMDDAEEEGDNSMLPEKLAYPSLPEEPTGDKNLICRVGIRLPDGRNVQRSFLRADPIQLLWSFCCSHLEEAKTRPFRLMIIVPGASQSLDYGSKQTFQESRLANSRLTMIWD